MQEKINTCTACPKWDRGPHRYAGRSGNRIMLIGQAPSKPQGPDGKPFSAGGGHARLFSWLAAAGFSEEEFRAKTYMTSIIKCYPGKNEGGKGDRRPGKEEIEACGKFLEMELDLIRPKLILPVGGMSIGIVIGEEMKLKDAVGKMFTKEFPGWSAVVIPLPHPSGASLWNNLPENKFLVSQAIDLLRETKIDLEL